MDQKSSKPTIDNLPDDCLIEVLSYLSPRLRKECSLVCRRCGFLTIENSKLSNFFQLI